MKKRAAQYMLSSDCPLCHGKRLRREALSVTFAGLDIAELSRAAAGPARRHPAALRGRRRPPGWTRPGRRASREGAGHPAHRPGPRARGSPSLLDLGLGYLSLERSTPTLSPGELQRLRLATQVRSNLFGVVYVLDEPSAGLHPGRHRGLLRGARPAEGVRQLAVRRRARPRRDPPRRLDRRRRARPRASRAATSSTAARPRGSRSVEASQTRRYLFDDSATSRAHAAHAARAGCGSTASRATTCDRLDVAFPLGVFTTRHRRLRARASRAWSARRWSSWSREQLGHELPAGRRAKATELERPVVATLGGRIAGGMEGIKRLVRVDQKPIGRTPRSNLATYTGLFDHVRKLFAATPAARARRYDAGRFSFNVAKGRCATLRGRGLRHGRAAVPAQRLRAVPDLPRRALQRRRRWRSTTAARTSPTCWA